MKKALHVVLAVGLFAVLIAAGCSSSGGGGTTAQGTNSVVVSKENSVPAGQCTGSALIDGSYGITVNAGIDLNSNGVLDTTEITSTQYVCNGSSGSSGASVGISITTEPAGANCANGGFKIEVGPDTNGDGAPDSVTSTDYVCNGTDTTASTVEQCLVCHASGGLAAIQDMHTVSPLSATADPITVQGGLVDINQQSARQLAGLNMTGSVQVIDVSAGTPVVDFTVQDSAGNGIIGLTATQVKFAMAQLQSSASGTYWQSYMVTATSRPTSEGTAANMTDNGDGTYSYTFAKDITAVSGVTYNANNTHRLTIQVSGTVAGGSLNDRAINVIQDFVPANLPAFTGTASHDIVTAAACNNCHYKIGTTTPHGGRVDTKYCVVCHTYQRAIGRSVQTVDATGALPASTTYIVGDQINLATDPTASSTGFSQGEMNTMVHKIHMGENLKLANERPVGVLANDVTYPQDIRNCTMCHQGTDSNNWKTKPSRKACGSCHDNISFATSIGNLTAHSGGSNDDDTTCSGCHPASGGLAGITDKHIPIVPPDTTDPRMGLGGTNTHTNAEYIAAANALPTGAHRFSWLISSVTVSNNHPAITFKFHDDTAAADVVFTAPTDTTSELFANVAGSPSAYFVWAEPQDGRTTPSDFNKSASVYIRNVWNGVISGTTATMIGPDGSGYYTIVRTGTTLPSTAVMLTGGIGYSYGSGTPPLVQTNVSGYLYTAASGTGGLAVPSPNAWKVATGYTGRRAAVDTDKCNACHVALGAAPTFHVGQRNDAPTCSFCHNPGRASQGWAVNASTFVHAIHGASKRTVNFTWDATSVAGDEADAGFFLITYPNELNKCDACHVGANTGLNNGKDCYTGSAFDFSCVTRVGNTNTTVYTDTVMNNMLLSTTATGTLSSTDASKFDFSPYITMDVNYGSGGSGDNLVSSPIAAACFSCHDSSAATAHMKANGGSLYEKRSVVTK